MRPKANKKRRTRNPTASGVAMAILASLLALAFWSTSRQEGNGPPPRNVLLITIDTLRADALGVSGNSTAATPWLDRLAGGGLRFDNARAHNVVTLPSHVNILTGRLPLDHGVRDNSGFRVSPDEETLATRLKAHGFRTGAFVSAFPLDSRFGLSRGFDVYDDRFVDALPRPAMLEQERPGAATIAAAQRWLQAQNPSEPWFCWVHLYEPHFPYAPAEPYASRFRESPYAGEVAATDAALQPLLQPILEAGVSTRTLVVVTSDHGEALGDHEEATHGIFAYDATLKVPLLLYYPALIEPGVVTTPVSHVDIAPTTLAALQMPAVHGLRGRSLLPRRDGGGGDDPVTYFEALSGSLNRGWAPLFGVVSDGLKYIELPIPELYDLRADAGERRNLAAERPQQVAALRSLLRAFSGTEVRRAHESADTTARLRSLGYVASTPTAIRRDFSEEDDPKRLIRFETRLQQVFDLYLSGRTADALASSRALVKERPDMRVALLQLAHLEREAGNLPAAIWALQRALELNPDDSEAASLLGASLTAANRPRDAIELLQPYAARRGADVDVQVLVALALAQSRAGRADDGLATLDRARAQDPSNAMLLVDVGTLQLMAGRRVEARKAFESALAINPEVARAHSSLAALAAEEGRPEEALPHWRAAVGLDPGEYGKLLAIAISLARSGRAAEARPYFQYFADTAPSSPYASDIERARVWLSGGRQAHR